MHAPHLGGVGAYTAGTVLAVAAAVLFAVGSVLQHEALSGRAVELRVMLRRPMWLGGQAATASGSLVQVAALALAPVSIVQPLLAGAMVIALVVRAVWDRCLPRGGEVLGAACTVGGLTAFLLTARPAQGRPDHLPSPVAVLGVVAGVVILIGAAARTRRGAAPAAVVCGVCAGIAAGCGAVLISAAFKQAGHNGNPLTSVAFWFLVVAAVVAAVAAQVGSQQAYSRGALAWSLPALTVLDPLAAIPAARLLLGERLEPGHAAAWGPAALVAVVGVVLLARTGETCRRPLVRPGAGAAGRVSARRPP